jgi:hypothetical protein
LPQLDLIDAADQSRRAKLDIINPSRVSFKVFVNWFEFSIVLNQRLLVRVFAIAINRILRRPSATAQELKPPLLFQLLNKPFVKQLLTLQRANLLIGRAEEADRRANAVDVGEDTALAHIAEPFVAADDVFEAWIESEIDGIGERPGQPHSGTLGAIQYFDWLSGCTRLMGEPTLRRTKSRLGNRPRYGLGLYSGSLQMRRFPLLAKNRIQRLKISIYFKTIVLSCQKLP